MKTLLGKTRTSRIERSLFRYPLIWLVRQSGAAVEHNDVILTKKQFPSVFCSLKVLEIFSCLSSKIIDVRNYAVFYIIYDLCHSCCRLLSHI